RRHLRIWGWSHPSRPYTASSQTVPIDCRHPRCGYVEKTQGGQVATNQQRREAAKRKLERQLARRAERARRRRIVGVGVTVGAVVLVTGLIVVLATRGGDSAADETDLASDPSASAEDVHIRSEEHTSELQSRENL